jgi:hypothetical protein
MKKRPVKKGRTVSLKDNKMGYGSYDERMPAPRGARVSPIEITVKRNRYEKG